MGTRIQNQQHIDPDPDSDDGLMARLCAGDDLALNALMERWQRPLMGFIIRYSDNYNDAVDLAQETFVRIYENRQRYRDDKGTFSTWMFSIAVNLCRNHARWNARHPSVSKAKVGADAHRVSDTGTESIVDPSEQPDNSAIRGDEAEQVRHAVLALPHDLKTATLLFEFEGLSHAEIARVLGCTAKAIETRLYRARHLLRKRLENLIVRG